MPAIEVLPPGGACTRVDECSEIPVYSVRCATRPPAAPEGAAATGAGAPGAAARARLVVRAAKDAGHRGRRKRPAARARATTCGHRRCPCAPSQRACSRHSGDRPAAPTATRCAACGLGRRLGRRGRVVRAAEDAGHRGLADRRRKDARRLAWPSTMPVCAVTMLVRRRAPSAPRARTNVAAGARPAQPCGPARRVAAAEQVDRRAPAGGARRTRARSARQPAHFELGTPAGDRRARRRRRAAARRRGCVSAGAAQRRGLDEDGGARAHARCAAADASCFRDARGRAPSGACAASKRRATRGRHASRVGRTARRRRPRRVRLDGVRRRRARCVRRHERGAVAVPRPRRADAARRPPATS